MMKAELTLKGMKCSNCANKVEKLLKENILINTACVNLITDKVFISLKCEEESQQDTIEEIKTLLSKSGFTVLNVNLSHNKKDNKNRIMSVKVSMDDNKPDFNINTIISDINSLQGIQKIIKSEKQHEENSKKEFQNLYYIIQIEYDPLLIKGINLLDHLEKIKSNAIRGGTEVNLISENNFASETNTNSSASNQTGYSNINFKYQNQFLLNLESINSSHKNESKMKFILCVILTLILMYLAMWDKSFLAKFLAYFHMYLAVVLTLAGVIITVYGLPIYKRAISSYYNDRMLNMESLITLGSLSAIMLTILNIFKVIFSHSETWHVHGITHSIEAAATVLSIATIGKYIEDRAKINIRNQKMKLFDNLNKNNTMRCTWMRARNRNFVVLEEREVDVGIIEKDELIKLKEKDFLMVDGVVVNGEIEIKEDVSFGYDVIQKKTKGDKIKAGCEVTKGSCVIMVEEVLENSLICKLTEEVSSNLNQKLKFQNFLDKIIKFFVPFIIILAIITLFVWLLIYLFLGDTLDISISFVIEKPISILVVSCPCAFGLAIPTVITIALNLGLKHGMLIKNVSILSEIKDTNIFVFDKTGTLCHVSKEVKIEYDFSKVDVKENVNDNTEIKNLPIFEIIAEMEKKQKHPIAESIYSYCIKKEKPSSNINFTIQSPKVESNGMSTICKLEDIEYEIRIGNYEFIKKDKSFLIDEKIETIIKKCRSEDKLSLCFLTVNNNMVLIFSIDSSSSLRAEAEYVVHYLQNKLKKQVYILSGDAIESVVEVGKKLNIPEARCFGSIDNRNKKEVLQELRRANSNNKILMIGDGINDVLSLSEADFGISFNANSNLNLIASDIIFVKDDLRMILSLIKLSKLSFIFIVLNVFWAFVYNICMIPITAGIFYSWKIDISPTFSSFSMLCSSLLILITSNILRFFTLDYVSTDRLNLNDRNQEEVIEIISTQEFDNTLQKSSRSSISANQFETLEQKPNQKKINKKIYQRIA